MSKIVVTDDTVIVDGIDFGNDCPEIDTGGRSLMFSNNYVRNYTGMSYPKFRTGGDSSIISNIFLGPDKPVKKKWWAYIVRP